MSSCETAKNECIQESQTAVIEQIKSDELFQQMAFFAESKRAKNPDFKFAWISMKMGLALLQFI